MTGLVNVDDVGIRAGWNQCGGWNNRCAGGASGNWNNQWCGDNYHNWAGKIYCINFIVILNWHFVSNAYE